MILFKPGTMVKFKDEYKGELPDVVANEPFMILGEHKGHQHYAVFHPEYPYGDMLQGLITNPKYPRAGSWALLYKVRLLTPEEKKAFDAKKFPSLKNITVKLKKGVARTNVRVAVTIEGLSYGGNEYSIAIRQDGSVHLGAIGSFDTLDEAIVFAKRVNTPAGIPNAPGVAGQRHRIALLVKYGRNLLPLLRLVKRLRNMKGRIVAGNAGNEQAEDDAQALAAEKAAIIVKKAAS